MDSLRKYIAHYSAHLKESSSPGVLMSSLGEKLGLKNLGIHYIELAPGAQSSRPHAESLEDEFCYLISGEADLWLNGYLWKMKPGDAVGFPHGTGNVHTIINNSPSVVKLLVVGERSKKENKFYYPLHPELKSEYANVWWENPPQINLGPHRGQPGSSNHYLSTRPNCVLHYQEIKEANSFSYPGSIEKFTLGSALARKLGIQSFGIHHETLPTQHRSSWPHAESDEDEFCFILKGTAHVWLNGHIFELSEGSACAFPCQTGISHCLINNSNEPVEFLGIGQNGVANTKIFYPLHPQRKAQVGEHWWENVPKHALGPHNGLPNGITKER